MEETLQTLLRLRHGPLNEATQHRHRHSASSTLDESTELPAAADESITNDDIATLEETWPEHQDVHEDEVDGLATITDTGKGLSSYYGETF